MKTLTNLLLALLLTLGFVQAEDKLTFFELRTYHAAEGKLEALHARFRDHTMALFEKHGMTNIAYWVPTKNEDNVLIYLLGYPDADAKLNAWMGFREDPEWEKVKAESEKDGKLVDKVDSLLLVKTDYSPSLPWPAADAPRLFEMRRYSTEPGKLDKLDARFRDHTMKLFEKHGMTNLHYFHPAEGQEGAGNTLVYFLAFETEEGRDASFQAFGKDPDWHYARDESEKEGKILVQKGVQSTLLIPTDYSPVK